jgi:glycosyltransferase involved in cell wall biosynthesis
MMVARMAPGKGHDLAIDALARLPGRAGSVTLVLVGDGPLRTSIENKAARVCPDGSRVVFLGQRDDVPDLLRAGDLLLLPSSAEGLGLAAIEAMAACLPVVGLRVSGTSEVVVDGETGILADTETPVIGLAGAMEALIGDPELAQSMGRAGRARAVAGFSLDNTSLVVDLLCDIAGCPDSGHSWEVSLG